MRRLRASAGRATRPRTYTAHAHRNVRAAAGFLAWLADRQLTLAACRQADVDAWLATGPAACEVRDFLSWAAAHGHCQAFTLPGRVRVSGAAASQEQRWAQAARLLHDDALDLTDRAAGCLLLLYGQQLSRIAAMTTSQVSVREDAVLIRFGDHDLPVPEPLAAAGVSQGQRRWRLILAVTYDPAAPAPPGGTAPEAETDGPRPAAGSHAASLPG
jgi:hypothetical protein